MRRTEVRPEFVEFIPDRLEDGVIYVSIRFDTIVHACCCGCGSEVVTPLSPVGWSFTYDGQTISLDPSVGSWALKCQSHYWIDRNRVDWAPQWSTRRIAWARRRDAAEYRSYYDREAPGNPPNDEEPNPST